MSTFKKGNKIGNRFKPGQSGNPTGRPKAIIEVVQAARERTAQAIETLTAAMKNEKAPWAARVSAACAILDRGWGRAPQSIEITRKTDYRTLTDDELIAIASGAISAPNGSGDAPAPPSDKSKFN
jgi:hypothetical protein